MSIVRPSRQPSGLQDRRFGWAYIFGAARSDGENAFAFVLPEANAKAMLVFFDAFSATRGAGAHDGMVLARAGWHDVKTLKISATT